MADYYIDTAGGQRGPYSEDKIIEGVKSGKIPTGARIRDAATNEIKRAVDLAGGQPADSGSYSPPAEYRAEGQHRNQYQRPASGPRPAQNYYQQPQQQPQYGQSQYPQQQYQQPYPQQGYGQQQRPYGNQMPYGQQYPYPVAQQTSGMAIAALSVSCASILICPLISIVGIILGAIALKECQPNGPKLGRGMALAGIWIGVGLTVLSVAFIGLIIAADSM